MGKENSKVEEKVNRLVRISPVETDRTHKDKDGKLQTMQRLWMPDRSGRYFPPGLSVDQLKQILSKTRVKVENVLLKAEGDFIIYQYQGRPLIRLNLKDGQFYSPISVVEEHGKDLVQQQAHIVLDKLKETKLSNATMGKASSSSSARQILNKLKTYGKDY
jgi:hypothetical protein